MPIDPSNVRSRLNTDVTKLNSEIREFNKQFKLQVPEVKTFGSSDIDAASSIKTVKAAVGLFAKSENRLEQLSKNIWGAAEAIANADRMMDQRYPQTRRANSEQKIREDRTDYNRPASDNPTEELKIAEYYIRNIGRGLSNKSD